MRKAERGFTLVELAIVLVIIGIILGAVLKGRELINNAKAKRTLNDLKGFEVLALTFYDRYGRLPGDGDRDGLFDGNNLNWNLDNNYDDNPSNQFLTSANGDPDAPLAELERARLVPVTPHRVLARHPFNGGFFYMAHDINGDGARDNLILVEHIPCYAAKVIDTAIDGTINATQGKIIETTGGTVNTTASGWTCANEDDLVEFVYLLD
ncbi:prepilin-type N-terminal cleavage/methylation domain-containing protein [Persephonella atlantica]|uniref:Prepilin-type N-terminal cleavage/methylation domain-containing protein n=1 Tax=Persephonella atlantica TaxID=2699429 RepID=A0ABS1GFD1_9AQUI|nr:prepilin-type N-terminal cleavage/methylation domain-containing protein [Persephonella atlantica]MBK3331627.1 prepilin-type N-terminal cleavage/methylation domain-containing protein [Persephonella atlantica]